MYVILNESSGYDKLKFVYKHNNLKNLLFPSIFSIFLKLFLLLQKKKCFKNHEQT